jgi:hypothetical protein
LLSSPFFSFTSVVAKKATTVIISFFKCFVIKKTMAC